MTKFILAAALLVSLSAGAQTTHYGNAERAKAASHHSNSDMETPAIRLGYIEADDATMEEFMDNLEVGLRPAGFPDSRIISYTIRLQRKGADYVESDVIKGNKIPHETYDALLMSNLKAGDHIIFENIKLEDTRHAYRRMEPVYIKLK